MTIRRNWIVNYHGTIPSKIDGSDVNNQATEITGPNQLYHRSTVPKLPRVYSLCLVAVVCKNHAELPKWLNEKTIKIIKNSKTMPYLKALRSILRRQKLCGWLLPFILNKYFFLVLKAITLQIILKNPLIEGQSNLNKKCKNLVQNCKVFAFLMQPIRYLKYRPKTNHFISTWLNLRVKEFYDLILSSLDTDQVKSLTSDT